MAALVFCLLAPLAADAQPLSDRNYGIDLTDLPVLGAPRAVGLGGAFGAVGEGVSALPWNPAAVASRGYHEPEWLAWDVALGAVFPSSMSSSRFFGNDPSSDLETRRFTFFDVGLRLQFGPVAVGALVRPRNFIVTVPGIGRSTIVAQTSHLDLGVSLLHGELVIGAGIRLVNLTVTDRATQGRLLDIFGAGVEVGATYRPTGESYRVAGVFRTPITAHHSQVDPVLDALVAVPRTVGLPWELALSGVFGFGERPLNATLVVAPRRSERRRREQAERARALAAGEDPDAEVVEPPAPRRSRRLRPRYGLISAELVVQGRVHSAIGLDGFLEQTGRPWGNRVTVAPRAGIEGEPWRNRMKLRTGTYLEPARSAVASPRMHFTSGFDLRLFDMDLFGLLDTPISVQITFTGDLAPRYESVGFGVGIWH